MISIPVAVYDPLFEWQLDLFWHNHKRIYGVDARSRAHAIIINRNHPNHTKDFGYGWKADIPYTLCDAYFEYLSKLYDVEWNYWHVPLNIQAGLKQIIDRYHDDQVLELLDCDMFYLKPSPALDVKHNHFYVETTYEAWHLKSMTENKIIIDQLIGDNKIEYYNGGFVPIIGTAKTFKEILDTWIYFHFSIFKLLKTHDLRIWWAGMYSFQAACEVHQVKMVENNLCYLPPANFLESKHYIAHYAVDFKHVDKRRFPKLQPELFPQNPFYRIFKKWFDNWSSVYDRTGINGY